MFRNKCLFWQKVDMLDQPSIDDITQNWAGYHLSYDWCKFARISDVTASDSSFLRLSDVVDNSYAWLAGYVPVVNSLETGLVLSWSLPASMIGTIPAWALTSTNVQDALDELDGIITSLTASDIVNVANGDISATNVQDALDELDTEKASKDFVIAMAVSL